MNTLKSKRGLSVLLAGLIVAVAFLNIVCYDFLTLPPYQQINSGQAVVFTSAGPFSYTLDTTGSLPSGLEDQSVRNYELELAVAGLPLKSVQIEEVAPLYVQPGGQAVGVLLQTNGVTVVGQSPVIDENGQAVYPAKEAGLEMGDFIISLNGQTVRNNEEVAQLIDRIGQAGQLLTVKFTREGKAQQLELKPLWCSDSQSYRIGIYVRDNTAGVGTLTFYEEDSGVYGALGHQVSDLDGQGTTEHDEGSIVKASIQGIKRGERGTPGEKIGTFLGDKWRGTIEKNCQLGVFGKLETGLDNPWFSAVVPVATIDQVQEGAAEIYTVLEGEKIEKFTIEIEKLLPSYRTSGKGMIIKVTDPALLARTGGIIQGMSGSPILQNGCLVGAVTHVFVNDPEKGYACFARWMMEEAGLCV